MTKRKITRSDPLAGVPLSHHVDAYRPLIEQAEIVSFDVFDTLLVRPFAHPTDVFELMERRSGIKGFKGARILAEHRAREKKSDSSHVREVTLTEIYQQLKLPDIEADCVETLMTLEIETEESILERSPYVGQIYDLAVSMGKRVVAVSDMYLPEAVITRALEKNALSVERTFVSCAYDATKYEGSLFHVVAKSLRVNEGQIIHFGDNFVSDCAAALQAGVIGCYVPSLLEQSIEDGRLNQTVLKRLKDASGVGQTNLFASLLASFIAQFHARQPDLPVAQLFGAGYAGPLVSAFASWLSQVGKEDGVKHMRLATRDGYMTKKVWDRLDLPGQASVFQTSRRLTMVPALYNAFDQEIGAVLQTSTPCSLRKCIQRLELSENGHDLLQELARYTELDDVLDTPEKKSRAHAALEKCRDILRAIALRESEAYQSYLEGEGFSPDDDAFADCGWAATSQRRTEYILNRKFKGYYIGTLASAHMHDNIRSFLFHKGDNWNWMRVAEHGVELLELAFASTQDQICRFEKSNNGVAPIAAEHQKQYEILVNHFVHRMQSEIVKFADFLAPFRQNITIEEMRKVLYDIFEGLIKSPSRYEYENLATLPHSRELGASGFATIGTFWITKDGHYFKAGQKTSWRAYAKLGWDSLRQENPLVTWLRVKRVIRRRLFG